MCSKQFNIPKEILAHCNYCKEPIYEDDGYVVVDGKNYHYDKVNYLNNCYFHEDDEDEDEEVDE